LYKKLPAGKTVRSYILPMVVGGRESFDPRALEMMNWTRQDYDNLKRNVSSSFMFSKFVLKYKIGNYLKGKPQLL
jgi:hypothetical protein